MYIYYIIRIYLYIYRHLSDECDIYARYTRLNKLA